MSERVTILDGLVRLAVQELTQEEGSKNFDKFQDLARRSNVPTAFTDAAAVAIQETRARNQQADTDEIYLLVASKLFERQYSNPTLASYAIFYGYAVASTKLWLEQADKSRRLEEAEADIRRVEQKLREHRHISDRDGLIAQLNGVKSYVSEAQRLVGILKDAAISNCGLVVIAEEQQSRKSPVKKIGEMLVGRSVTQKDFDKEKKEIEKYFKDPRHQARMILIANSGR